MARKSSDAEGEPMGSILFENLDRLGYVDRVARSSEIAKRVSEKTGKPFTRQRVLQLLNAVRINPETIELLASGLGVKSSELMRKPTK